jgi:hypothetical protein
MLLYHRPYKSRGRTVGMGEFTTARRPFPRRGPAAKSEQNGERMDNPRDSTIVF